MIPIKKKVKEPQALTKYRETEFASYNGMHGADSGKRNPDGSKIDVYTIVLNSLMEEQGHICAYCMRPIPEKRGNPQASIEHIVAQSHSDVTLGLDYKNMLAVCSGNRGCGSKEGTTCDAHRGNCKLYVNPLKEETLQSIYYSSNGRIKSDDDIVNKDINDTLNLNCLERDLIRLRKAVLNRFQKFLREKGKEGDKSYYKRVLRELISENEHKKEYVGILIWWLNKQLKQ